jgi:23S rRNA (guanosine2251-2'-O)-methyltransferase
VARPLPPLGADEELVAGRRPVEEAFAAQRPALRLLVVPQRRQALERIVLHATTLRIPIVEVEGGSLTSLAGFDGHQGIALVVAPRRFASLDDILARAIQRGEPPLILVLDSLEDPQNVGTLLRSAEAAGAHGVVFPTERQAPLSPAAIKASAGATEHLLLAPVDDLPGALADLHVRGLRVLGSDAEAPLTAREADLRGPVAIVVGSEGHGLSPAVRRRCDLFVRIPMRGAIGSLNAAVAGSVLLFEALGQRDPAAKPEPGPGASLRGNARDREPDRLEAGLESDEPSPAVAPEVIAPEVIEAPRPDEVAPADEVALETPPARRTRARKPPAATPAPPTAEAPEAPTDEAPAAAEKPAAEPPVAPTKPARARRTIKPPTADA